MSIEKESTIPVVLVIDDDPGIRDMLAYGLGKRNYRVVTASGGEEALRKVGQESFDLAVCDIMMPGMGGIEVLKGLKQVQPAIEVIMATGFATLQTAVESMKLGAYDYVTKPYGLDQICLVFDKALERRRLKTQVGLLEEINRVRSEFMANMSHELRTPMAAILGYISLLLSKVYGDIPPKQRDVLGRVETNAKNLLQLINNVLDFSKLSARRMTLFEETFELKDLVEDVLRAMEPLAQEKSLTLSTDMREPLGVHTDKTRLKQILINLVGNGIKFTSKGGVSVHVDPLPAPSQVQIVVQDTGIGIKTEDLPQLFQEFKQLDSGPTRHYSGTGLGLAICKQFAELMQGTIHVQSTPGTGSRFILRLPIGAGTPAAAPSVAPSTVKPAGDKLILSIDDDPEVLRVLSDSLQGTGYTSVGAQSGEEGLVLARKLRPFCITLDIMMPHLDGWSVLQGLKNDPELKSIPVFVVSVVDNKALAFSLGVTDYILKPFTREDLLYKLGAVEQKSSRKILVADDDPRVRELFSKSLSQQGYQVEPAADGEEALARVKAGKPDILFLDLVMPKISGFDVLEEIDKDPSLKKTIIFVMTEKNLTADETQYLEKRVEMIVQKKSEDLHQTLQQLKEKLVALGKP